MIDVRKRLEMAKCLVLSHGKTSVADAKAMLELTCFQARELAMWLVALAPIQKIGGSVPLVKSSGTAAMPWPT